MNFGVQLHWTKKERERGETDIHQVVVVTINHTHTHIHTMQVYSYQFKTSETPFGKDQMCLSGKIGGMRDDVAICCQLVVYWSGLEVVPQ